MTSHVQLLAEQSCPTCEGAKKTVPYHQQCEDFGDRVCNYCLPETCENCDGTGVLIPGLRLPCGYITMYYTVSRGQIWSTRLLPPPGFPDGIRTKCRTLDRAATPHLRTAKWASECKGGCHGTGTVLIPLAEVMGVLVDYCAGRRWNLHMSPEVIEITGHRDGGDGFMGLLARVLETGSEAVAAAILQALGIK